MNKATINLTAFIMLLTSVCFADERPTGFILGGAASMSGAKIERVKTEPRTGYISSAWVFYKQVGVGLDMLFNSGKRTYNNFLWSGDKLKIETTNYIIIPQVILRYPGEHISPYISGGVSFGTSRYNEKYTQSGLTTEHPFYGIDVGVVSEAGILITPGSNFTINAFVKYIASTCSLYNETVDGHLDADFGGAMAGLRAGVKF